MEELYLHKNHSLKTPMNSKLDSDITILSQLHETLIAAPEASQRDIAKKSNMSLGMTNAVLKRFVEKGWVMMHRLSAKKVCYMVTPDGIKLVASRTYNYMQRTFRLMNEYQSAIVKKISEIKGRGFTKIVLFGQSDISFLIEYACKECGVEFSVQEINVFSKIELEKKEFALLSEQGSEGYMSKENCLSVMEIVTK